MGLQRVCSEAASSSPSVTDSYGTNPGEGCPSRLGGNEVRRVGRGRGVPMTSFVCFCSGVCLSGRRQARVPFREYCPKPLVDCRPKTFRAFAQSSAEALMANERRLAPPYVMKVRHLHVSPWLHFHCCSSLCADTGTQRVRDPLYPSGSQTARALPPSFITELDSLCFDGPNLFLLVCSLSFRRGS